jgi:uncharacterized protein YjbI with pentapeptide repeats
MAQLGNTDMRKADFRDTRMTDADLRCADLRGAINLTVANLRLVKTLYRAQLDDTHLEKLKTTDARLFDPPADTWHHLATPSKVEKKDICE